MSTLKAKVGGGGEQWTDKKEIGHQRVFCPRKISLRVVHHSGYNNKDVDYEDTTITLSIKYFPSSETSSKTTLN